MQSRVALWCVCVAAAVVGLVAFLGGDVFVSSRGGFPVTGLDLLEALVGRTCDVLWDAARRIDLSRFVPDPAIWIGVGTLGVLGAPLALRGRPSLGLRGFMMLVTLVVAVGLLLAAWGLARQQGFEPGPAFYVWAASVVLLCASPWLRRRDQLGVIAQWDARPHAPRGELPGLSHLPPVFAELVRETRAVRVSFDVLVGLDRDARQLLWEWCRGVDECSPDDRDLLRTLGLEPASIRTILDGDAGSSPFALHELDAALARFEHTLLQYRSYAFR